MEDRPKEIFTTIAAEALEKKRTTGAVDSFKPTGKWRGLEKEAVAHFLKSRETPASPRKEMFSEEFWEGLDNDQLREGQHEAQYWQAKKFTFKRGNGKQEIEERVVAHADARDRLAVNDREQQVRVSKQSTIVITQQDGTRICINDFLPPGYTLRPFLHEVHGAAKGTFLDKQGQSLVPFKEYRGSAEEKSFLTGMTLWGSTKEILYDNIAQPGSLLALFHEIGHAWDLYKGKKAESLLENSIHLQRVLRDTQSEQQGIDLEAIAQDASKVCIKRRVFQREGPPLVADRDVLVKIVQEAIDSERGPTAFALNILRWLEQGQGFCGEPGFTILDVKQQLTSMLRSYQLELDDLYYSDTDRKKMEGIVYTDFIEEVSK